MKTGGKPSLPSWTYWAPFLCLFFARVITVKWFYYEHFAVIYLPYIIAVPMYFWWGPRIFSQYFISEALTAGMTLGTSDLVATLFFGLANGTKVLMGYLLYKQVAAKVPLKSQMGFGYYFFWVLFMQNIVGNFLFLATFVQAGAYGSEMFWRLYFINTVKDIFWGVVVMYPILIYVTPKLRERNWARNDFLIS